MSIGAGFGGAVDEGSWANTGEAAASAATNSARGRRGPDTKQKSEQGRAMGLHLIDAETYAPRAPKLP
jgi:hypothetical protein